MELFNLRKQIYSFTLDPFWKNQLDKIANGVSVSSIIQDLIIQYISENKKGVGASIPDTDSKVVTKSNPTKKRSIV